MQIEFSKYAQKEMNEAILYYELEQSGLGLKFKKEVQKTVDRIKMYPKAGAFEREEVRKYFLHKFPYKILYSIRNQTIII